MKERNYKKNIFPGILLILIGVLFLLNNYNINTGDWFVLGVGLVFLVAYFTKQKKTGFLVTGCILAYLGTLILLSNLQIINRHLFGAIFLMTLGAAFLTVYFAKHKSGFLLPGLILPGLGIYSIVIETTSVSQSKLWPLFFMILATVCLLLFVLEFKQWSYKPLIPAIIFFGIGVLGFMAVYEMIDRTMWLQTIDIVKSFWPILLVFAGIVVIIQNIKKKE